MSNKADIIKNNIKNKVSVPLLTSANFESAGQNPIPDIKYHNFSDNILPGSSYIEYDDRNKQEGATLDKPELNLALLKNVLSSLLKILKEENEAMNTSCSMDRIIKSQNDKNDFNQYLEWQKPLIDDYLLLMRGEVSVNTKAKSVGAGTTYDFATFQEIAELIQNARNAAKENVLLLERRKFFNEQFINFLAGEISSHDDKSDYKYSQSAFGSRSSVYQNRKAVIVNKKT